MPTNKQKTSILERYCIYSLYNIFYIYVNVWTRFSKDNKKMHYQKTRATTTTTGHAIYVCIIIASKDFAALKIENFTKHYLYCCWFFFFCIYQYVYTSMCVYVCVTMYFWFCPQIEKSIAERNFQ